MPPPTRRTLRTALLAQPIRVFTTRSWAAFVRTQANWGAPAELRSTLLAERFLTVARLSSESGAPSKERYLLPHATPIEVAATLQKGCYLCHATAAALHGLTEQVPSTFYVNVEQSRKAKPNGELTQEAIDWAFRVPQRSSTTTYVHGSHRFVQVNGKNSSRYGVIDVAVPGGRGHFVPCTDLERTLVDLMVRPGYAGGVFEVLEAFRLAKDRASVSGLLACLRALDYSYPYHQSLGFYLTRAGYPARHVARVKALPRRFDFPLAYGMSEVAVDPEWRVRHPRAL